MGLRARLVLTGILIAITYWLLDTATDAFYYEMGSFSQMLVHPPSPELWMRVSGEVIIAIFYAVTIVLVERHRRAELALQASERNLSDVAAISPVGIFRTDPSGQGLWVNQRWCEITGVAEDCGKGETWTSALHPADTERVLSAWRAFLGEGDHFESVYRFVHPGGQVRWVLGQAAKQRAAAGHCIGVVGTLTDISERVLAQESLRRSEELYRSVYSSGPLAIVLWDPVDGQVLDWNAQAERLFGWRREEAVGRQLGELVFTVASDADVPQPAQVADLAASRHATLAQNRTRDGALLWCEWYSAQLHDSDGRPSGLVSMALDVTDRLRAEEEIKSSLREKDVLLREIHHRVKNNLQVIATLLDLQTQHSSDQTASRILRESRGRVHAMALIHEKLYRSHRLSHVDLPGFVSDLLNYLVRAYGVDRGLLELAADVAVHTVNVDTATQIGLIINELVSNALKYAFDPGQPGRISVAAYPLEAGGLRLVVADTGRGVPEGIEPGRTRTLGLQLVGILTAQLHGDIKLVREQGTRFEITVSTASTSSPD